MAFKNYLDPNFYTVIDHICYQKQMKLLEFTLIIYSDATRDHVIAQMPMEFSGLRQAIDLEDINIKEPPLNPIQETPEGRQPKWGLAPSGCSGKFADRDAHLAVLIKRESGYIWLFESNSPSDCFYVRPTGKFYKKNDFLSEFHEISDPPCRQSWEKYFSTEKICAPGTNLYRQIYLWLKTQPGFEYVEEA